MLYCSLDKKNLFYVKELLIIALHLKFEMILKSNDATFCTFAHIIFILLILVMAAILNGVHTYQL